MARLFVALLSVLLLPFAAGAQQRADAGYKPRIERPAYAAGAGPVVAIDEAHANFHTLAGKYAPFGALLTADGYRVRTSTAPFSALALRGIGVLVIANARSPAPGASAFTADEIAAVRDWVSAGGSLLLISDHAPFGTAASRLAAAFGVNMGTGYVAARGGGRVTSQILFRGRQLGEHAILAGRDSAERVRSVRSFTGQSLSIPPGATALLALPADALEVASAADIRALAQGGRVRARSAAGRAQAIAMPYARGRLVVSGEAAMFTEQIVPGVGRVGLLSEDDERFALNALHWLSRLLPAGGGQ
jgi:hypothetical protein